MSGGEPAVGDTAPDTTSDTTSAAAPDAPPVAPTPFTMLGAAGAAACEGDACIIPPSSNSSAADFSPAR